MQGSVSSPDFTDKLRLVGDSRLHDRPAVYIAWRYLIDRINEGALKPGQRLPSAEALSPQIGVSRPVVLEALSIIQGQGRVHVLPGRGGVTVLDDAEASSARETWLAKNGPKILELAHLREMLEPGVARLAAQNGLPGPVLRRLRSLVRTMIQTDVNERYAHFDLDVQFHSLVVEGIQKPQIGELMMSSRVWMTPALHGFSAPDRWPISSREHKRILKAIEARNPNKAAEAALVHVQWATAVIESRINI